MTIYLEMPILDEKFPFRTLCNDGDILTTPHWHKEFEIVYVKKGELHVGIGKESYFVGKGEFILIPGGKIHYILTSPDSIRYVYQFNEQLFNELRIEEELDISIKKLWNMKEHCSSSWDEILAISIKKILDTIYELDQNKQKGYYFAAKGHLCNLIYLVYMQVYTHNPEIDNMNFEYVVESNNVLEKLDTIFRFIEKNYNKKISLGEAADCIGYTPFYFAKFFKRHIGKTFLQFLNEYRIDKAKWILINEDADANEIIERVGITNAKTYYRLFKEFVGVSPKKYQAEKCKAK